MIKKPDTFDYSFKVINLDNGLKAVCVNCPDSIKGVCSMSVRVGTYQDPIGYEGLAHFCEHMLFMGTKKFPNENEYEEYLTKNNGFSNAYTDSESTNYYFTVNETALEGAVDRFSDFFKHPLFKEDGVKREMHQVDSEHIKNKQNDFWREAEIMTKIQNQQHPGSRFGTGNLETLDKSDIREVLLDFYNKHYDPRKMKLVMASKMSLKEQEILIRKYFSDIKKKDILIQYSYPPIFKYKKHSKKYDAVKFVKIKSIQEMDKLKLIWYMYNLRKLYYTGALEYISHLIGHEYENSLANILKKKELIHELYTYPHNIDSNETVFQIDLVLTPKGRDNIKFILDGVNKFIKLNLENMIRKDFFNEIKIQNNNRFKFLPKYDKLHLIDTISESMDYYPDSDILYHQFRIDSFKKLTKKFLTLLLNRLFDKKPVVVSISNTHDNLRNTEHFYGAEYQIDDFVSFEGELFNEKFDLPIKNIFLINNPNIYNIKSIKYPQKYNFGDNFIWYLPNIEFNSPSGIVSIRLYSNNTDSFDLHTIHNELIGNLWSSLFIKHIETQIYYANLAGFNFNISKDGDSINLKFTGYTEGLYNFIQYIFNEMAQFIPNKKMFSIMKQKKAKIFRNFKFNDPMTLASYNIEMYIDNSVYDINDYLTELKKINLEHLYPFWNNVTDNSLGNVLISGNVEEKLIEEMTILLKTYKINLLSDKLPINNKYKFTVPNNHETKEIIKAKTVTDDNNAVKMIYITNKRRNESLSDAEYEEVAIRKILCNIIHDPFFDELRTKEKMGYIVHTREYQNASIDEFVSGIAFSVQSPKFTIVEIKLRIIKFISEFENKYISKMTDKYIEDFSYSFAQNYKKKFDNMEELHNYTLSCIFNNNGDFNLRKKMYNACTNITKDKIVKFYKKNLIDTARLIISSMRAKN